MESAAKPTTMSENARAAAKLVAAEQQKRPGKKVAVVAIADGYDGFKVRTEGERFAAFWLQRPNPDFIADNKKRPKGYDPKTPEYLDEYMKPSWQMEIAEYDKQQAQAAKEAAAAELE
jgi:hypothetical protein